MIKDIPTILSLSRIALSLILLFLEPLSPAFLLVVAVAALTDVFDGILSRRMGNPAEQGRLLDSIADGFLVVSLLVCIIPNIDLEDWMIWWIAAIAIGKVIAIAVGTVRYKKAAFLHSYLNKATSAGLYLSPFFLAAFGVTFTVVLLCSFTTVSTIGHLYCNLTRDEYDPNTPTMFIRPKEKPAGKDASR